jgi:hypothetical protein
MNFDISNSPSLHNLVDLSTPPPGQGQARLALRAIALVQMINVASAMFCRHFSFKNRGRQYTIYKGYQNVNGTMKPAS